MKEQTQFKPIDLDKIEASTDPSHRGRLEKVILGTGKLLEGVAAGMGVGGTAVAITGGILGIYGATVAGIVGIATGVGVGVVLGALGLGLGAYQLWKAEKENQALKASVDEQKEELQDQIVSLLENFQELESLQDVLQKQPNEEEVNRIRSFARERKLKAEEEEALVNSTLLHQMQVEVKNRKEIKRLQEILVRKLHVALLKISGTTDKEKLQHLFQKVKGQNLEDRINEVAQKSGKNSDLVLGALKSVSPLLNIQTGNKQESEYLEELDSKINQLKKSEIETPKAVKALTYITGGLGGAALGMGLMIGIGAFAVGGIAAFLAIGWPVIAPLLIVGAVFAGGAILVNKYLQNKQAGTNKMLYESKVQLSQVTNYLELTNSKQVEERNSFKSRLENERKVIQLENDKRCLIQLNRLNVEEIIRNLTRQVSAELEKGASFDRRALQALKSQGLELKNQLIGIEFNFLNSSEEDKSVLKSIPQQVQKINTLLERISVHMESSLAKQQKLVSPEMKKGDNVEVKLKEEAVPKKEVSVKPAVERLKEKAPREETPTKKKDVEVLRKDLSRVFEHPLADKKSEAVEEEDSTDSRKEENEFHK